MSMIDWKKISLKERKKAGVGKRLKSRLWKDFAAIQHRNLRRDGSSFNWEALYRDMEDRVIIDSDITHVYVFIKRLNKILKAYKRNLIDGCPSTYRKLGLLEFNPVIKIMMSAEEC